jgi:hypothetical protein
MNTDAVLHNVFVLYFILLLSLANLFYLVNSNDYAFAGAFILIGFITSFFSKNMVVILCIALVSTNVLQFGKQAGLEGVDETLIEEESELESENTESPKPKKISKESKKVSKDTLANYENVIDDDEKTEKIKENYNELSKLQNVILGQLKLMEEPLNKAENLVNMIEKYK